MHLSDLVIAMILSRLPIDSIMRLRWVCKDWKSLLESFYFDDLYKSVNQKNMSSPWLMLYKDEYDHTALEVYSERLGFMQPIGSCVSRFLDEMREAIKRSRMVTLAITERFLLLDVSTQFEPDKFCVADPILRQWINIPQNIPQTPPYFSDVCFQGAALVTNMNNGDLLGYKVVLYGVDNIKGIGMTRNMIYFLIYSSDSGDWTYHHVPTEQPIYKFLSADPINLNGYLHWLSRATQVIIVCDFFSPTGLCHVINLPQRSVKNSSRLSKPSGKGIKETLSISCGSLMYMKTDTGKPCQQLKIWRLKNYTSGSSKESWDLLWNVRPGLDLCIATDPVAMHPFSEDIVYLVTRQANFLQTHAYLVQGNLRTKKFHRNKDWKQEHTRFGDFQSLRFHQFVLPKRLDSIPCPPGCALVTLPYQQH